MHKVVLYLILVLTVVSLSEAWWGGGSRRSSSSRSSSRSKQQVVKRGPYGSIRKRDETGHRTGLGTIARSFVHHPIKTTKAIGSFVKSYMEMRSKNVIGGNLAAHEKANYEATKVGGAQLAAGISALREQYKRYRSKTNPDGTKHIGDTRTKEEIKKTMNANEAGREKALGRMI